jgi:hypothetical protein
MVHIEHDESGHVLIIVSESITDPTQIDDIRRVMKALEIHRAILRDVFSNDFDPREEAIAKFDEVVWECFFLDAVMLIPRISPLLEALSFRARFVFWLVASGVPFFAFDRPELTQESLIAEIRRTGEPIPQDSLDFAVKNARRFAKSRSIRKGLTAAKERGTTLGNPRIVDARAKAHEAYLSARPSKETFELMQTLKREGKSLREIARALNERNIKPPRGRQWYGSSVRNQLK